MEYDKSTLLSGLEYLNRAYTCLNSAQTLYDTGKSSLSRLGYSTKSLDIRLNIKNIQEQTLAIIDAFDRFNKNFTSDLETNLSAIFSNYVFNYNSSNYKFAKNYSHEVMDGVGINASGAAMLEGKLGSGNVKVVYYSDLGKIGVRYNQGSHAVWNRTKIDGVSMNESGCGLISIAGVLTSVISNQNGQITYITPTDLARDLSNYSKINGGRGLTDYVTNSSGLTGDYDKLGKAISEIYGVSVVVNQKGNLSYDNYKDITNSNTGIMYSSKHESHINAVFGTNNGKVYECDTSSGCANYLNGTNVDPSKRAIYISSSDCINVSKDGNLTMNGEKIDFDIGSAKEIIVNGKTYQLERDSNGYVVTNQEESNTNYLQNQNKTLIEENNLTNEYVVDKERVSSLKDSYQDILDGQSARVNTKNSGLNLRQDASVNSEKITTLSKDSSVFFTGEQKVENGKTWAKVVTEEGQDGWVVKDYLDIKETPNKNDNINIEETNNAEIPLPHPTIKNDIKDNNVKPEIEPVPEKTTTGYVDVTSGNLNVRDENGQIIGKLGDNQEVKIIDGESNKDGYTKIEYNGKEAYVFSDYLKEDSQDSTIIEENLNIKEDTNSKIPLPHPTIKNDIKDNNVNPEIEPVPEKTTTGYVDVTSGNLNVRNEDGQIIGKLPDNQEVKIIDDESNKEGYVKIEYDGKEAYVYSEYLKTDDKSSSQSNNVNNTINTSHDPFDQPKAVDIKKPLSDPFNQPTVTDIKKGLDASINARVSANFRSDPGLDSDVLGYLMKGDEITVIDSTPVKGLSDNVEYVLVENSKGQRGYVAKCYVDEIEML